ncbi:MAG: endopeptidase La [Lentisphaeria bacterium]
MTSKKQKDIPEEVDFDELETPEADDLDDLTEGVRQNADDAEEASESLPIIPLPNGALYPYSIISITVDTDAGLKLLDDALEGDRRVAVIPVPRQSIDKNLQQDDFFPIGARGRIVKSIRLPDESRRVLLRGTERIQLESLIEREPYFVGNIRLLKPQKDDSLETEAIAKTVKTQFQELIGQTSELPDDLQVAIHNVDNYGRLADLIADTLNIEPEQKLAVLGTLNIRERLELILSFLSREEVILQVGSEIQHKVNKQFAQQQREHFLREQLKAIQEQLGQEPETPDVTELRERLDKTDLPDDARETAESELRRLRQMHPAAADYNVARSYIEWILSLPWRKHTEDSLDINKAKKVLDRDHYDLTDVKDRILEFLAVLQLKSDMNAPILCFVGPPGVGKTSLGRSIASALGRNFVRISLGGVRDEAEIRGHRRTYVGALPGRIIQGLHKADSANPVFMLDEIDKLGADFRGDPGSALLEVLDPEQNSTFSDHYLETPFDLSSILFITTANLADPIPAALKDRMEIIRIPGYTRNEKAEIAKRFLIPRQLKYNGLQKKQLSIYKRAVEQIIDVYTAEAGVRNLEREIGKVCRKYARRLVQGEAPQDQRTVITDKNLREYLGARRLHPDTATTEPQTGISTGLAWTAAGGEIMHIEVNRVPGSGKLILTGSLGDVMKESARIALTYVNGCHKSFDFEPDHMKNFDVHVHVPAGATPKDGPSAGLAIAAALVSLFTGKPLRSRTAMTGELSLQGRVLPVGGIKEKILAAARAGVKTVLIPAQNQEALEEDVPESLRRKLRIQYCEKAADTLKYLLQ